MPYTSLPPVGGVRRHSCNKAPGSNGGEPYSRTLRSERAVSGQLRRTGRIVHDMPHYLRVDQDVTAIRYVTGKLNVGIPDTVADNGIAAASIVATGENGLTVLRIHDVVSYRVVIGRLV